MTQAEDEIDEAERKRLEEVERYHTTTLNGAADLAIMRRYAAMPDEGLDDAASWGNADPGIECAIENGMTTCTTPGGKRVTFPVSEVFPSYIGPGVYRYHYYSKPFSSNVDPETLMRCLIRNPTPAPGNVRAATPEGTLNEATPHVARNPPISPVISYLVRDQNGDPVVVNVTQPRHGLAPGIVIRYVTPHPNGSIIQNEGAGLGSSAGKVGPG